MHASHVFELNQCSDFRQTLEAKPPALVHGAALLAAATVAAAAIWAGVTEANLVIRGAGRVRPVTESTRIFISANPQLNGRIAELNVREGSQVRRGDVLLRLDASQLENNIDKVQRTIRLAEEELLNLDERELLLTEQLQAALAKANAELLQAQREVARQQALRETEVERSTVAAEAAEEQLRRLESLVATRAVTRQAVSEAEAKWKEENAKLRAARLPVDESRLGVLQQAVEVIEREAALKRAELDGQRVASRRALETARKELANLLIAKQQSVLRSPIDGVVIKSSFKAGDVAELGKPVIELAEDQAFCFETYIPSDDVGLLSKGLAAQIKFDAYDYQRYGTLDGVVDYISPDSTLLPSEGSPAGAAGSSVVYKVRIRLLRDYVMQHQLRGDVKLGLSGQVEVITDRQTVLSILLKRIRSSLSLG